jgi:hypothetical protein
MKKNIRASFRLVASLLAVFAVVSLMTCQQPTMISRKKPADSSTEAPVATPEAGLGQLPPFSLVYDGKNASLSPFETLAASARSESGRSLGGFTYYGITSLDDSTLNYFQWVFMDADADGVLYAYDEADSFSASKNLTAAVVPGHTYHVLLLGGYRPDTDTNPTLLASAYTQFKAIGEGSKLNLTLIPVVVDVKFSGGSDGDRQLGRLVKTVGLDKEQTYTLEYFIGSNNRGVMATGDALKEATNDGLWPLKLASAEVRKDDTWYYKYSTDIGGGVHQTKPSYQPGVLDAVEVPLNNAYGTNLAWVEWSDDRIDAMNDLSVDKVSKKTTGRG